MPDLAALAGQVMLVAGATLLVAGLAAVLPRLLRVRRRARLVQARLAAAEVDTRLALELLLRQRAETDALLDPWRRLLRWARHPLVVATVRWYLRRRARA